MADDDVSPEMREKGWRLCREFVGGGWASAGPEDVHISRVRGGLSNMIYQCELSDQVHTSGDEPRKVLLRMYGQIIQENPETVVTDSVIYALLAEKRLGPKLYGVFMGGRVEEYVKHRKLKSEDLRKPAISSACARVMASFHRLRMPLIKEPRWLFDIITRYLDEALNNMSFNFADPSKREKLQMILSYGLSSELQCLKNILGQVHSPVVFCHNDLQEGNILYSENSGKKDDWQLIPIDFEYASYNYRGFDIGNHFCEWCYDYDNDQPPYFTAVLEKFPSRDQQLHFIRSYLENSEDSSMEQALLEKKILKEVAAYTLGSHFMWGVWSVVQSQISDINFGYLEYALARFEAYFHHKKRFLEEYSINGM